MKFRMILVLFVSCLFTHVLVLANVDPESQIYTYKMDLTKVEDDKLSVELLCPAINKNKIKFMMPAIIPGTYTIYDFGRFVTDLNAYDKDGNLLEVKQKDVNTWIIKGGKELHKMEYKVDDSFDSNIGKSVSGMSGTNIEENKNYLINGHGFFGYFEGMKDVPIEVHITKQEGFYGSSAYTNVRMEHNKDIFRAKDYAYLMDMPIMYCKPDTTIIRLDDAEVLVSVYSPNGLINTDFLKSRFEELLQSQNSYLNGLIPVDRYAFLMYFMSEQLPIGTGALEHNYSSVYCLPEIPQEQIAPFLIDISSHEFFHILTPLNVHSEEIHYFDFNDPEMSRHLWMYEGVTEYFSHHNQVRSGLITQDEFLDEMAQKIKQSLSNYQDDISFTKMSKKCLDKYADEYGNVYMKGALIAMCLDIELLRLSAGQYGMINLMGDLIGRYGSEDPFSDKELFSAIEDLTYPEIGKFLKVHVKGKEPIPYEVYFDKVGYQYEAPGDTMVFSFGSVQLGFNSSTNRLQVSGVYSLDEMGRQLDYKVGDEILKIQGKDVPISGIQAFVQEIKRSMKEGEPFIVTVLRKDANDEYEEIELKAQTRKIRKVLDPGITTNTDATQAQLQLRNWWLRGAINN